MVDRGREERMGQAVDLYADDGGAGGLPVVFLHSNAGNVSQWSGQLDHLRPRRRAVALDWRGHGRSGSPENGDFSLPTLAADVARTVDRLGLERFVLVGHSSGGLVALEYAGEHPGRVAGLLVVDPAGDFREVPAEMVEPFLAKIQSDEYEDAIQEYWQTMLPGSEAAVRERVLADLKATPKETVVGFFEEHRKYDPLPALRRYPGPALSVVTPSNDEPFSLHNLGVGLPHTTVTGTGHWLHMDKPEAFNIILDEFIARVESAS